MDKRTKLILGYMAAPVVSFFAGVLMAHYGAADASLASKWIGGFGGMVFGILLDVAVVQALAFARWKDGYVLVPQPSYRQSASVDVVHAFTRLLDEMDHRLHTPDVDSDVPRLIYRLLEGQGEQRRLEIADGYLRLPEPSVQTRAGARAGTKNAYSILREIAKPNYRVVATCYTHINEFWLGQSGSESFFELNLQLLLSGGVKVDRIFGVNHGRWEEDPDRKQAMIDLLRYAGCNCHTIDYRKLGERNDVNYLERDMFLILRPIGQVSPEYKTKDAYEPIFALRWEVDGDGNTIALRAVFGPERLADLKRIFDKTFLNRESLPWRNRYDARPENMRPERTEPGLMREFVRVRNDLRPSTEREEQAA